MGKKIFFNEKVPNRVYSDNLLLNNDFSDGLNHWNLQGNNNNYQPIDKGIITITTGNDAAIWQNIGVNTDDFIITLNVFLNGGTYRVLDDSGANIFLQEGLNVIETKLFLGHLYIKPTILKIGSTFTNIQARKKLI